MDIAISTMSTLVRPDALGAINAWNDRYGERGALKDFLEQRLRDVGAAGATTSELARAAEEAFGLEFETKKDWERFRHSTVGKQLSLWKGQETVQVSYEPGPNCEVARWRWKLGKTLDDLVEADRQAHAGG